MTITFRMAGAPFFPLPFLLAVSIAGAQVATNNPADRVYRNGVVFTADASIELPKRSRFTTDESCTLATIAD
jgi:hypothetical protein